MWLSLWGGGRVHWLQVVQGARASGVLWCVFRCFCPLYRFVLGALPLKYAFIRALRAFLARFGVVVWVCVACVLCVACGALYACRVRRLYDLMRVCPSFVLSFVFFLVLLLLLSLLVLLSSLLALFVLVSLWLLSLFLFPFRTIRKKKGRNFLRPLLSCCGVSC